MCLTFHVRVAHLFGMLKKESIFMKYLFSQFFFSPNLGGQIRCAQNQYTTVQTNIKYPPGKSYFLCLKMESSWKAMRIKSSIRYTPI